jgi:hypothetical protein
MMAISHAGHNHPATPAGRAACRKAMAGTPVQSAVMVGKSQGGPKIIVAKSPGTKGLREAAEAVKTRKKANTKIKGIGDLTDVPPMLAYAVRLAWAAELEVVAGHPFNDTESNIIIKGPAAHITCIWRSAQPNGIYAMRIRPVDSSVGAGDASSAQQAVDIARGVEPIPGR